MDDYAAACAEMMAAMGDAASAMPMTGGRMGAGGMMGMGWLLMIAFWLLVVVVLVLAAVALFRWLRRGEPGPGGQATLEHELGLRYVRGEIDRETYVRMRQDLSEPT